MNNQSTLPRVAIGRLYHEAHTFAEGRNRLDDCLVARGAEMLAGEGGASALDGLLEAAQACGWKLLPTMDVRVKSGPMAEDAVAEYWWQQFEAALNEEINGVFLLLHGAMATPSCRDVEGEMLRRVRRKVGPNVPIGGVTDLHANFSPAMAEYSNALLTYRENPHTDARETAVRATHLLDRLLREKRTARTLLVQPPLMWAPPATATADEPMRGLEAMAREIENTDADILAVNVHAGYSFADTPDTGVSFSAITLGAPVQAQRHLNRLADYALQHRDAGRRADPTPAEVFAELGITRDGVQVAARRRAAAPILFVEPSDNIGGGAPGDGTGMLQALLEYGVNNAGIIINDAAAVQQVSRLEAGRRTRLAIGGKGSRLGGHPVEVEAELISTSNGQYELEDKQSHVAAGWGTRMDMGPCAVVRVGGAAPQGITILLTSRKSAPMDLGQWRSQGIEPADFDYIVVKAAVAHRRAYDKIATASFTVATPGPCSSDLKTLPFRHVRRPLYPLDDL